MKVGLVFLGRPSPGVHNVAIGLFDYLMSNYIFTVFQFCILRFGSFTMIERGFPKRFD